MCYQHFTGIPLPNAVQDAKYGQNQPAAVDYGHCVLKLLWSRSVQ
jgi:hypothetical protein